MNPALKYRGGKSREIPSSLQYIPDNFDRYIEPFLGGGAVYFYIEPENAILNDVNGRLMTFSLIREIAGKTEDGIVGKVVWLQHIMYAFHMTNELNPTGKTMATRVKITQSKEEIITTGGIAMAGALLNNNRGLASVDKMTTDRIKKAGYPTFVCTMLNNNTAKIKLEEVVL